MRLDMRGRGAGKTYDMVQEHLHTPNSVILVSTVTRAESIQKGIPNGDKAKILSVHFFEKLSAGSAPFDVVFIDELETVLRFLLRLSGAEIVANSSGDPEKVSDNPGEVPEESETLFSKEFIKSSSDAMDSVKKMLKYLQG